VKAGIYCRVSTEDQAEAKTIENQVEFAHRYCELHSIEIADQYLDEGISGITALEDRPEGMRLIKDAKAKKFDLVLVYRLDRLARDTRHLLNIYHALEGYGVAIRSMTEQFDSSSPTGKFIMTTLGAIAALERETLQERVSLGRDRVARQGKWLGGNITYGYKSNAGKLEIDEKEARVVRQVFDLYAEGKMKTVEIADYLNATNVPTAFCSKKPHRKTKGEWTASSISRMLNNEMYIGIHRFNEASKTGREIILRKVPALIDQEIWDKVQKLLRKNFYMATRKAKRRYLLRGIIKCGLCGANYCGQGHNGVRSYYRCFNSTTFRRGEVPKCRAKMVRAEELENIVWEDIKRFVKNPGEILPLLEEKLKTELQRNKPVEEELSQVERQIAEKQSEREKVISLFRRGHIGEEETINELTTLAKEIESLTHRREMLFEQQGNTQELKNKLIDSQIILEKLQASVEGEVDFEIKRELVEALVNYIRIDTLEDRTPKVTISYCFDPERWNDYPVPPRKQRLLWWEF